ncbi:hypothetical protein C8R42DRAFT_679802 [Lentinula raphanica]|nr:hypothetical protein C8R42DRAFT_679802 [Lentinula raphanica]
MHWLLKAFRESFHLAVLRFEEINDLEFQIVLLRKSLQHKCSRGQQSLYLVPTSYHCKMNTPWRSTSFQNNRDDRPSETSAALIAQPNVLLKEGIVSHKQAISSIEPRSLTQGLRRPYANSLSTAMDSKSRSTTLSPIHTLPTDILAEIFSMLCLGDFSLRISRPGPRSKDRVMSSPTLVLTHICSYWRQLVDSLPLLWSTLSIESRYLYGRPAVARLVVTYIARSGSVPLKFQLKSEDDAPDVELEVFDALLENASRWQEATLLISPPWLLYVKAKLGSRLFSGSICFPRLEHLVLDVQHDSRFDQNVLNYLPSQIIQSSPRLDTFRGFGYDSMFHGRGFGDYFNHQSLVTKLVLQKFTGRSLSHLLSRFPNLQEFSIGGFVMTQNPSIDVGLEEFMPPYTSKITHLCHSALWDSFQRGAWQFLRVPNLVSLDLRFSNYSLDELSSLLSLSRCSLIELRMYNFPIADVIKFLSSNPSVLHLSIHVDGDLGSLNQLISSLTLASHSKPIVPHLLSFELSWNDWTYKRLRDANTMTIQGGIVDAIYAMVRSRLSETTNQKLQRFALRIRDGDFLEFESLYDMMNQKFDLLPGLAFETLTPPSLCKPRFS